MSLNLIDSTYFHGSLVIPNSGLSGFAGSAISERLNGFISVYEKHLLTALLGETLYFDLMEGLDADEPDDRWIDLKEQLVDEEARTSPIAAWVYYNFQRTMATISTGVGEMIPGVENGSHGDMNMKLAAAWNECRDGVVKVIGFLVDNYDVYEDWELLIKTGIDEFDDLVITNYRSTKMIHLYPFNRIGI